MRLTGQVPRVVVIEVTNTLQAASVTGYQRFVREFVRELRRPGSPALDVVPVVWDAPGDCYRRLTAAEDRAMTTMAPDRVPVAARSLARERLRAALQHPAAAPARRGVRAWRHRSTREQRSLRLVTLPTGAVFFDAEPAWHDPRPRSELLPALRAQGLTVVTMVADVLPQQHPEWFEPRVAAAFGDWLSAHLASSQLALAISEHTRGALQAVAESRGLPPPPTQVVQLGADFAGTLTGAPEGRAVDLPPAIGRFLLVVGTLEPRKNHALALEVFTRLAAEHPDLGLVLVGKQGWLVEPLVEKVRTHPLYGTRLLWLSGLGDGELSWLFQHAYLALVPSWSEGLGLPLIEALRYGVPAVASTGGALPEAGGPAAELVAPDDVDAWTEAVRRHLEDPGHHGQARARAAAYQPPTWEAAGQAVRRALADAGHSVPARQDGS